MKRLKVGTILPYNSKEALKFYLDKGYIFKNQQYDYTVIKDIHYKYPYRFVYPGSNEELSSAWTDAWEVFKVPKCTISFKRFLQCN